MNTYQTEQLETLRLVRQELAVCGAEDLLQLKTKITEYLAFRTQVAAFLKTHFQSICTDKCYQNRLSACCSKDGIITFFADVVVNVLASGLEELAQMERTILAPANDFKCIYLTAEGCRWRIKPIVCEFFLCDEAENKVFGHDAQARKCWEEFSALKKTFNWPDRTVLFETIEHEFMARGCRSPLMYLHNSPGLVRIRRRREERHKQ